MKPGMGADYRHDQTKDGSVLKVVPGMVVQVEYPEDLVGVEHKYEALDPVPPPPPANVSLKPVRRSDGYYDVVNPSSGQKLNDRRMSKVDAYELASKPPPEPTETDDEASGDSGPEETTQPTGSSWQEEAASLE